MARYFTHYWSNATWENLDDSEHDGEELSHTAGNLFRTSGVSEDDFIYIITVQKGWLYVLARMEVDGVYDQDEAAHILETSDLWEAKDHVIAKSSTQMRFESAPIPMDIAKNLEFFSSQGTKRPKLTPTGILDQQTLRAVRELTPESAHQLDQLIKARERTYTSVETDQPPLQNDSLLTIAEQDIEAYQTDQPPLQNDSLLTIAEQDIEAYEVEESYTEGKVSTILVNKYERNPKLREAAINIHGMRCQGCGFSFIEFYGERGRDYIEVHHLRPISSYKGEVKVNPNKDMAVVCSNCHRMIHRTPKDPLSLDELREIIRKNRS